MAIFFRGARLIDGNGGVRGDATIVIEGERISAVALDRDAPQLTPDDTVFDLGGRTLMPGMIQTHFHSTYENGRAVFLQASPTMLTLIAARHAETLLRCGFTGAVGAGTPHYIDVTLRDAINAGLIPGPRFMASGPGLVTSGDLVPYHPSWWEPNIQFELLCDGPEEFRKAVRQEASRGVDIIKTYPTGGHGVKTPTDMMTLTVEEMKAAADAAHEHGKKIRGHITSRRAIVAALDARYDVIDHADLMDEACIERFVEQGTFIVPSLCFQSRTVEESIRRGTADTPAFFETQRALANMRNMLPLAQKAGVKLVVGDDFGVRGMQHGDYAAELETYVNSFGIAPLDVIGWATRNGAELLGLQDELGTIEVGKFADLLVVNGDPVTDIGVLKDRTKLDVIMKGGVFVERRLQAVTESVASVAGVA